MELIKQQEVLGKTLKFYGDWNNPYFLAKEVAEWIEYDLSSVNKLLESVDADEKLYGTIFRSGQNREMWFLTEDGLYEVLLQSRKPIAKEFKKQVKAILKTIRKEGRSQSSDQSETYSPLLQELMYLESEQKRLGESLEETRQLITDIRDVVALDSRCWREDSRKIIENIALRMGGLGHIPELQAEIYRRLEVRAKVNLRLRLANRQRRMLVKGVSTRRIKETTILDVVEEDLRLVEIYVAIVKEMAVSNGVGLYVQTKLADFDIKPEVVVEMNPLLLFEFKLSDSHSADNMGSKFVSEVYAEDITEAALLALEEWGDKYPYLLSIHEKPKLAVHAIVK